MSTGHRFDVSIGGRGYLVDYSGYRRRTMPALKEQRDTSTDVGENTLSAAGQWVRSQTDWSHGAGQRHYDLVDSDRARFDTSKNVDVFTNKGELSILKAIESKSSGANTNVYARLVNADKATFYFSDGSDMKYGDPSVSSPSFSSSAQGAAVSDWTSDGTSIYSAVGTATKKVAVSSTSAASTIGTFNADVIEYANGRLLAADGARVVELDSSGTVLSFDNTLSGTVVAIKGGPQAIYVAANANGQGILYAVSVSASDGSLDYPVPAATLPVGETFTGPFSIDTFGDLVVAGTSSGCRFGVVNEADNKAVTFGPVIDTGGAAYGTRIVGRYAYWGTSNGDTYKADLTYFTATLTPAYARWLAHDSDSYGNVQSVEVVNDMLVFSDSNGEVYGEDYSGDLSTAAELTAGIVSFGTVASKVARAVSGRFAKEEASSASGDFDYRLAGVDYASGSYNYRGLVAGVTGTTTITMTDQRNDSTAMVLTGTGVQTAYTATDPSSETFVVKITLARNTSDTTDGPTLERWSMDARPQPRRIEEIVVPLVMQGRVATSHGSGASIGYATKTEYDYLKSLATDATSVTYAEGSRSETVTVEDVEMTPVRYSDDGSWWEGTLTCRMLTVPT